MTVACINQELRNTALKTVTTELVEVIALQQV